MENEIITPIDRTNLEEYAGAKLKSMTEFIELQKAEGKESVMYPWYVPLNPMKHLEGYKRFIFEGLIQEGNHVTDFLPGSQEAIGGLVRDIFICWTQQAKADAESEGKVFKIY